MNVLLMVYHMSDQELEVYNLSESDFDKDELDKLKELHHDYNNQDLLEWFDEFIDKFTPVYDIWDKKHTGNPLPLNSQSATLYCVLYP